MGHANESSSLEHHCPPPAIPGITALSLPLPERLRRKLWEFYPSSEEITTKNNQQTNQVRTNPAYRNRSYREKMLPCQAKILLPK
jgi:hypothetical protein